MAGKEYIFIDTAGLRRKGKIKEEIERYSVIRTVTAVERAHVVVIVIDATEGVTEQDAKIAGIAHERGKGVIIAVNKWDAVEKDDKTIYKHTNRIREVLAYMPYAELVFISARQVSVCRSFLRPLMQLSRTRHSVSRPVFLMRSSQKPLPCSSRRLTVASVSRSSI